jgi:hypothetical protein
MATGCVVMVTGDWEIDGCVMSEIVGVDGVEVACVVYNRDVAADD